MKKVIAISAAVVALSLVFVGCGSSASTTAAATTAAATTAAADGGSSESNPVVGTWVLDTMVDADGNEMTVDEYAAATGVDASTLKCTMVFNADGTCTQEMAGVKADCTYTVDGDVVNLTYQGTTYAYGYDAESDTVYYDNTEAGTSSIFTRG